MKTALSLESQLDPAGSRAFQNHLFSMFFEASILGVFLGASFIDFFMIFNDFGGASGPPLAIIGEAGMMQ